MPSEDDLIDQRTVLISFVSLEVLPNMASELAESGKAHQKFIEKYRENLESLLQAREDAARNLVAWLRSDLMKEAEVWFRTDDVLPDMTVDKQSQVTIGEFVKVVALAHARLAESEAGAKYALEAIKNAKGTGAVQGVERVITDFILPDESEGPSFTKVSLRDYERINTALRNSDGPQLAILKPYIDLIRSGLAKLPKHQGTVYRIMNGVDPEVVRRQFVEGQAWQDAAFVSASHTKFLDHAQVQVQILGTKNGGHVSSVNPFAEREVLLPPGSRATVRKVIELPGDRFFIILEALD